MQYLERMTKFFADFVAVMPIEYDVMAFPNGQRLTATVFGNTVFKGCVGTFRHRGYQALKQRVDYQVMSRGGRGSFCLQINHIRRLDLLEWIDLSRNCVSISPAISDHHACNYVRIRYIRGLIGQIYCFCFVHTRFSNIVFLNECARLAFCGLICVNGQNLRILGDKLSACHHTPYTCHKY
jgi:hypothetical protein